jgi:hypothetical protein
VDASRFTLAIEPGAVQKKCCGVRGDSFHSIVFCLAERVATLPLVRVLPSYSTDCHLQINEENVCWILFEVRELLNGFDYDDLGAWLVEEYRRAKMPGETESDTKSDSSKKFPKNSRRLSNAAVACAKIYKLDRKHGGKTTMKDVVKGYLAENEGKASTILRELSDNPGYWKSPPQKSDKKTTQH